MEWGIIKENDPYLYGEKVKAYLRRGARELPGFAEYPNNQVGYGRLCLSREHTKMKMIDVVINEKICYNTYTMCKRKGGENGNKR